MKKQHLKKLAIVGLTSGLLITSSDSVSTVVALELINDNLTLLALSDTPETSKTKSSKDNSDDLIKKSSAENSTYHLMTEDELYGLVNDKTWKLFQSLNAEGKTLALEMVSRVCNNTNSCKGTNACQTASNPCAGKGPCKAHTKCSFGDKNQAVKIAAQVMEQRRQGLIQAK